MFANTVRIIVLFVTFSQFCKYGTAQNLVLNPDFEKVISNNFNENSGSWMKCINSDTPDYFTDSSTINVFKKYIGGISPHSGHSFVGFFVYRNRHENKKEIKEFIQCPLTKTLKKDSIYSVEMYIAVDEESNVSCDGFGIYFSDTIIHAKKAEDLYLYKPQITNPINNYFDINGQWIKFEGNFKAAGNENFIVIGNFKPNILTNTKKREINSPTSKKRKWYLKTNEDVNYIYIDDISVVYNDSLNKEDPLIKIEKRDVRLKSEFIMNIEMDKRLITESFLNSEINQSKNSDKTHSENDLFEVTQAELKKGVTFHLNQITFEFNKADFMPDAVFELNKLVRFLRENKTIEIEINGYTDNIGSTAYNIDLSIARAKAIEQFLIKNGIAGSRLQSYGYGVTKPIDTNDTSEGRAKNRRIEIVITKE